MRGKKRFCESFLFALFQRHSPNRMSRQEALGGTVSKNLSNILKCPFLIKILEPWLFLCALVCYPGSAKSVRYEYVSDCRICQ